MKSVPPRGSGWVMLRIHWLQDLAKRWLIAQGLKATEPTRYRVVVLTSWGSREQPSYELGANCITSPVLISIDRSADEVCEDEHSTKKTNIPLVHTVRLRQWRIQQFFRHRPAAKEACHLLSRAR